MKDTLFQLLHRFQSLAPQLRLRLRLFYKRQTLSTPSSFSEFLGEEESQTNSCVSFVDFRVSRIGSVCDSTSPTELRSEPMESLTKEFVDEVESLRRETLKSKTKEFIQDIYYIDFEVMKKCIGKKRGEFNKLKFIEEVKKEYNSTTNDIMDLYIFLNRKPKK